MNEPNPPSTQPMFLVLNCHFSKGELKTEAGFCKSGDSDKQLELERDVQEPTNPKKRSLMDTAKAFPDGSSETKSDDLDPSPDFCVTFTKL